MIVIDNGRKRINYFDSIRGTRKASGAPKMMKLFMESYYRKKGENVIFRTKTRLDTSVQENGVDCGVFALKCAEREAKRCALRFSQKDAADFRLSMRREILEGRLDTEERRVHHQNQSKNTGKGKVPNKANRKTQSKNDFQAEKKTFKLEHPAEETKQEHKDAKDGRKDRIEFPKANSAEWGRLDNDLTHMLKIRYAPPEIQAQTHPELIYILCRERFGAKVKREIKPQTSGPSKRQVKCQKLRGEINKLKDTYKNAPEQEKDAIKQLQEEKLKRLRLAKRAETMKRNRKKFSKNCNKFLSQPFEFARELIAPKPKGQLQSSKEEVETHLKKFHRRKRKNYPRRFATV